MSPGNATSDMRRSCSGKDECDYQVDVGKLGDPAGQCEKDFSIEYICPRRPEIVRKTLPPEAGLGSRVALSCR